MLLFQFALCVGAVLIPVSLQGAYFTLIACLCLYQIYRRNWRTLLILCFSMVFLIFHGVLAFPANKIRSLEWVDLSIEKACYKSVYLSGEVLLRSRPGAAVRLDECSSHHTIYHSAKIEHVRINGYVDWQERSLFENGVRVVLETSDDALLKRLTHTAKALRWARKYVEAENDLTQGQAMTNALLFGDKSGISEQNQWLIRFLGIAHVFVVSGLHIGFALLLAMNVSRLCYAVVLRTLPPNRVWRKAWQDLLLGCLACGAYGALSGWGEPVIRAYFMVLLWLSARLWDRPRRLVDLMAIAGLVMVWWSPYRIVSASFWLSFSFILILAIILPRLRWRWWPIQWILSLMSILLTLGWQGAISPLSPFINMVIVPLTGFVWLPVAFFVTIFDGSDVERFLYSSVEYVIELLWWLASLTPTYALREISVVSKLVVLAIGAAALLLLPLRRSSITLFILLACIGDWPREDLTINNQNGRLNVRQYGKVIDVGAWQVISTTPIVTLLGAKAIITDKVDGLPPAYWVEEDIGLVVTAQLNPKQEALLAALQVNYLVIARGEKWYVKAGDGTAIDMVMDNCISVLNLLTTDACKRRYVIEDVIN